LHAWRLSKNSKTAYFVEKKAVLKDTVHCSLFRRCPVEKHRTGLINRNFRAVWSYLP